LYGLHKGVESLLFSAEASNTWLQASSEIATAGKNINCHRFVSLNLSNFVHHSLTGNLLDSYPDWFWFKGQSTTRIEPAAAAS
jgi:hypothetical protein